MVIKFWAVRNPTAESTMKDIVFETSPDSESRHAAAIGSAKWAAQETSYHADKEEANKDARKRIHKFLFGKPECSGPSPFRDGDGSVTLPSDVVGELIDEVSRLMRNWHPVSHAADYRCEFCDVTAATNDGDVVHGKEEYKSSGSGTVVKGCFGVRLLEKLMGG